MAQADWPGTAGLPALAARALHARKSVQLPFATVGGESDAPEVLWGTGSPEGAIVGTLGDVFVKTDATPGFYMKLTGVDTNTGWSALGGGGVVAPLTLSHTVSGSAADATLTLNPTWNTTGSPQALVIDIVNTASGGGAGAADYAVQAKAGGKRFAGILGPEFDALVGGAIVAGPPLFLPADLVQNNVAQVVAHAWDADPTLELRLVSNNPGGSGSGRSPQVLTGTYRYSGTPSSPLPVQSGDHLFQLVPYSHTGSAQILAGKVYALVATGTWSATSAPTEHRFYAIVSGALTGTERFRVDATGTLTIGSSRVAPGTITSDVKLRDDTVTWNNSGVPFVGWKLNVTTTAQATGSRLILIQTGGTNLLTVHHNMAAGAFGTLELTPTFSGASGWNVLHINPSDGGTGFIQNLIVAQTGGTTWFNLNKRGNTGIGGGSITGTMVRIGANPFPTGDGNTQIGLNVAQVFNVEATTEIMVLQVSGFGNASAHTTPNVYGVRVLTFAKGTNQTITTWHGVRIHDAPTAGTAFAFRTGSGEWFKDSITHSVVLGNAALATTATDGFVYLPSCAGAPTGTPTSKTGVIPVVLDTTNFRLYAYMAGAWKQVTLA